MRPSLADPLRALVVLETVAMTSALVLDVATATSHLRANAGDLRSVAIYIAEFLIGATAVLSIPHRPNRRYLAIGVSVCSAPAMMLSPTDSLGPVVFLVVLAARMTFAFGLRGTILAWVVAVTAIMLDPVMKYFATPTVQQGAHFLVDAVVTLVLTSLLYGVVGIMWLYARQGAASAAHAERTRIALDLHDSLGHALTTLGVHLENAERLATTDVPKTKAHIARANELTEQVLSDVRETVDVLHNGEDTGPPSVATLLNRLRDDFGSAHQIDLHWRVSLEREPLGRSAHVLYRVVQEALTNAARHARASHVNVEVIGRLDTVSIRVQDDGCGFEESEAAGHGLTSMRSRVQSVAGTITITSATGTGTRIEATFPLEHAR